MKRVPTDWVRQSARAPASPTRPIDRSAGTGRSAIRALIGAALLAYFGCWIATPATAQLTPDFETSEESITFQAYSLKNITAPDAERQLEAVMSAVPGTEIIVDQRGNRLLVRGSPQAHLLMRQYLSRLDVPAASSQPEQPRLEAYALTPSNRQLIADWQKAFINRTDVRIAIDDRTAQALILAPPSVHVDFQRQMNGDSTINPMRATVSPAPQTAVAPTIQSEQWTNTGVQTQTLQLRQLDGESLRHRLERLLSRPLPAQWDATNQWLQFSLGQHPGGGISFAVNRDTKAVQITGPANRLAPWQSVVEALDQGQAGDDKVTQLVATKPENHDRLRQTLDILKQSAGTAGGAKTPALLVQAQAPPVQEGSGDQANQGTAPSGQSDARDAAAILSQLPQDVAAGLLGPVQIEFVEGLDIIVIRGSDRDVQRVMQIINQIEQLSAITVPRIEVVPLAHVKDESLAALLNRLYLQVLSQRVGTVSVTPLGKPNALLLIGRQENVQMAIELVRQLDQPVDPLTQFEVFPLRHASAVDAKTIVDQFLERQLEVEAVEEQLPPSLATRARVVVDARTNSLIVSAGPRDLAEIRAIIVRLDTSSAAAVDQVRVFQLKNTTAVELAEVLQDAIRTQAAAGAEGEQAAPSGGRISALELLTIDGNQPGALKSAILSNVRITADAQANSLVVTAPAESMDLIAGLIEQLDRAPDVEAEIKVFTMRNGDAVSLMTTLRELFGVSENAEDGDGGFGQENPLVQLQFSVDERTNSIIAVGSKADLEVVYAILLQLDSGEVRERVTTVYRLKNASAEAVALALNNWLQTEREVEQTAELAISPFEQIEREVIIVPELGSNSLIVSATPRYYEEIRRLIERLDERPPMVMIQVMIAEVTLNDTDEFGVELGLQDSLLFDRSLVDTASFLTTTTTTQTQSAGGATIATVTEQNVVNAQLNPGFNFNNAPLGNNGSSNARANASKVGAQGLSSFAMGRINDALGFGGFVFAASSSSVNVLLRALQEDRRLEVLSRPQIVALDGQEGYVLVGQRVPRIANTTINLGVQSNEVVYEDVGLILRVVPRVSPGPDGLVVMQIMAQKSQLGPLDEGIPISIAPGGDVVRSPIIDSTEAMTTVSALSGQTIVLSGLLTKRTEDIHRRVPLVSDIPLIGDLFRYDGVSETRRELLIILTPRVMFNDADVEMLKQVESSRMSWVMGDVIEMHGDSNLRSRCDVWGEEDAPGVYPTYIPREGEMLPPIEETVPLMQPGDTPPVPPQEGKRRFMPKLPSLRKAADRWRHTDGVEQAQYDAAGADAVRLPPL